jgi:hypothetical protein
VPADYRQWHRLFGIALTDLFSDTPYRVELEKDLALRSQLLDVVVVAQTEPVPADRAAADLSDLPDGLEDLRVHNLVTFKSRHEKLDGWALDELVGHYVNYRKLVSPKGHLLPEPEFGLYAVAVGVVPELVAQWQPAPTGRPGIFDIPWRTRHIRIVVLGEVEAHARNAAWELLHPDLDRLRHGVKHYRFRRPSARGLLYRLFWSHVLEDPIMPYTMEDFLRETADLLARDPNPTLRQAILDRIPPEERLQGLSPDEVLMRFRPEEVLTRFRPEERLQGLAPEERLQGLSKEDIRKLRAYLNRLD